MIPKIFHFIYLYGKNTIDFNINHYFSIKSNLIVNKGFKAFIHTNNPKRLENNIYIQRLKYLGLEIIDIRNYDESKFLDINPKPMPYMAHQADLLRLKILYAVGGIYSDVDSIAVNPIPDSWLYGNDPYSSHPHYCTELRNGVDCALCNGFILAPKESEFIKVCAENYIDYKWNESRPGTEGWGKYSVTLPWELYQKLKGENKDYWIDMDIIVHSAKTFQPFYCDRDSIEQLYLLDRFDKLKDNQIIECHLWETRNQDFFKCITERYFYESNATYAKLIRSLNII